MEGIIEKAMGRSKSINVVILLDGGNE